MKSSKEQVNVVKYPRLRNSTNFRLGDCPRDFDVTSGHSCTVPDQSMDLKVLIERYTRGVPVPVRTPVYVDEYVPDMERLDLVEQDEVVASNAQYVKDIQKRHDKIKERRKTLEDLGRKKAEEPVTPTVPKVE